MSEPACQRTRCCHASRECIGSRQNTCSTPELAMYERVVLHLDHKHGCTIHEHHISWLAYSHAHSFRPGVDRACRDRSPDRQTCLCRRSRRDQACDFCWPEQAGQGQPWSNLLSPLFYPASLFQIVERITLAG